jgi:pimeloyl-ACP methyl ester carboxylesterase
MLIQANGIRLFALEAGQGDPALVLVHGNGGSHAVWHRQIAYFSRITRVLALDLRGFGASGKDPEGSYTQDKFVADTAAVLNEAAVRGAVIAGWSMGGSLVARLAVEHPELAAAVVLVDHNAGGVHAELGLAEDARYGAGRVVQALRDDFEGQGMRLFVDSWFPESGPEIDFLKDWLLEMGLKTGRDVIYGIRGLGVREDRREWLRRLSVPVLIMQGGASYLGGAPVAGYLQKLIPHARKHIFEGHGHALMLTGAGEFNHVLHDFWRDVKDERA